MARTMKAESRFPVGTSVSLYPAAKVMPYVMAGVEPPSNVTAADTKTVAAGGGLTFTTDTAGVVYYAHAAGGHWIQVVGR